MTSALVEAATTIQPLAASAAAMKDTVDGFLITDEPSQIQAGELLKDLTRTYNALEAKRTAITKPIMASKKAVDDLFKVPKDQVDAVRAALQKKMNSYAQLQAVIAEEEAREARRKAQAEEASARTAAEALEASGAKEAAEQVTESARQATEKAEAAPTAVPVRSAKATISSITRWHAEIVDVKAFLQAVIDGDYPIEAVDIRMQPLNQQATNDKREHTHRGVRFYKSITAGVR